MCFLSVEASKCFGGTICFLTVYVETRMSEWMVGGCSGLLGVVGC